MNNRTVICGRAECATSPASSKSGLSVYLTYQPAKSGPLNETK